MLIQTRNRKKREVDLSQQASQDAEPFRIQWLSANWFSCSAVPVDCVALVAFFAMKISMNPTTLGAFVLLCGFVRPCPVALRIPP
jgi:hypothetical protein